MDILIKNILWELTRRQRTNLLRNLNTINPNDIYRPENRIFLCAIKLTLITETRGRK